jgi:hypothetical protein
VDDQFVAETKNIADASANHFKSILNTSFPNVTLPFSVTTDVFLTVHIGR